MKHIILICSLLFCFAGSARGQTHSATLTWTLSVDDTTVVCSGAGVTCGQNVYRASGACSSTSVFVLLSSPIATATTATDTTITPGTYCYAVTFVENGLESVKTTAPVVLPPKAPSNLAVGAQ